MNLSPPFAAIFDWDGVVIDSKDYHEASWNRLAEEKKLPLFPGHFMRGFGMKNEAIIPGILNWTQDPDLIQALSLRKEELYRDIVREKGIEPLPGVVALLKTLKEHHIPAVIGSSTHRKNIETTLEVLGLRDFFTGIISAEDVNQGKPDPQVFLKASQLAATPPSYCVVFEDAQVGIDAGKAGGMKVIGVATTHPSHHLKGADRVVDRLTEVDWQVLTTLFSSEKGVF